MFDGNTSNSMNNNVEPNINGSSEPQNVEVDKKEKKVNNLPRIMLIVAGVVTFGLVAAIIVVVILKANDITAQIIANKDNDSIEAVKLREERGAKAISDCNSAIELYSVGTNDYSVVVNAFEEKMLSSDPVYNVYFAMCYANFLANTMDDASGAMDVLDRVDSQLDNVNVQNVIDYYVAKRSVAKLLRDGDAVAYYDSIIIEMMGESEEVVEYNIDGTRKDTEVINDENQ